MPINLIDIRKKLPAFSEQGKRHNQRANDYLVVLQDLLAKFSGRFTEIQKVVNQASSTNSRLRCALPVGESLNQATSAGPMPERVSLIASDGSQINPSRHTRIPFCVINIGAVEMVRGSGETPKVYQESLLMDYDQTTLPDTGIISEGRVALTRDLMEREKLSVYARDLKPPAIAMIDGPLELYREPQQTAEFGMIEERFMFAMEELHQRDIVTIGYVDKPGSDLLVSLLELIGRSEFNEAAGFSTRRPVRILDVDLFQQILLKPGDRSAIFEVYSGQKLDDHPDQKLHFFYLNVGTSERQHLARVEVPAWVAVDKSKLALIQAALLDQTRIMGSRFYPYLLHRAHEVALVNMDEHRHVEDMIVNEFIRAGVPVGEMSQKERAKDLLRNGRA
jgi:hypothetical protein